MAVLVDTSAWIDYFRDPRSRLGDEVERLVLARTAVLVGIVYAEVLRGARTDSEYQQLASEFGGVEFEQTSEAVWRRTAHLLFDLRRSGGEVNLADAVIAAHALESGHEILTRDADFQRVPGLKLREVNA